MTITVDLISGKGELKCQPEIVDLYYVLSKCFEEIIGVASTIPKIEVILFPEIQMKGCLFSVSPDEEMVTNSSGFD